MPARASRARSAGANRPLSPTTTRSRGIFGASRSLVASVVSKVRRSRLLMPISRDRSRSARSSSASSCTSTSTSMPSANAAASRSRAAASSTRRHDDQDAVGAPGARLDHLIGVEHEILAQHRQRGRGAGRGEELRRALERRRIGEHRQARRAAALIGARQRRRIEVGADQALRRARLLDLGDQRVVAARQPALDAPPGNRAAAALARACASSAASGRARLAAAISSRL